MITVTKSTGLGTIRGIERLGVHAFLGVRYAEPPKRFEPCTQAGGWIGTYDATEAGSQAFQAPTRARDPLEHPQRPNSEDCLFLNIYAPAEFVPRLRPVLVWIHGGSFNSGSAGAYDGTALAFSADIVVVTINYRLGVLGLADLRRLGGRFEESSNLWFRDQLTALRWIRDHIADFGGDPANITVAGQSAGGTSVLTVLASDEGRHLVQRGLASSPAFIRLQPPADQFKVLSAAAKVDANSVPEWLLNAPAGELVAATASLMPQPYVDGGLIPEDPHQALARGPAVRPLITGYAPHEGAFLAPYFPRLTPRPVFNSVARAFAEVTARSADAVSDYIKRLKAVGRPGNGRELIDQVITDMCRQSSLQAAAATALGGGRAWHYLFDVECRFDGKKVASTHCVDIPFTFNWFADPEPSWGAWVERTDQNAALAQRWVRALSGFVRGHDPSASAGPLGEWPEYLPAGRQSLVVATRPRLISDLDSEFRQVLPQIDLAEVQR